MYEIKGEGGLADILKELHEKQSEMKKMKNSMSSFISKVKRLVEISQLKEICAKIEYDGIVEDVDEIKNSYDDDGVLLRAEISAYYKEVTEVSNRIKELKIEASQCAKAIDDAVSKVEEFIQKSDIGTLMRSPIINRKITINVSIIKEGDLLCSSDKTCIVFNASSLSNETVVLRLKRGLVIKGVYVVVISKDGLIFSETLPDNCHIKEVIGNV